MRHAEYLPLIGISLILQWLRVMYFTHRLLIVFFSLSQILHRLNTETLKLKFQSVYREIYAAIDSIKQKTPKKY